MKNTILLFVFIIIVLVSCEKGVNQEPIRINIDKEISKEGIEIWNKDIEYVELDKNPDIIIKKTNKLPNNELALTKWYSWDYLGIRWVKAIRPAHIYIRIYNKIILAHEFGHFLYLDDKNSLDTNSIMSTHFNNTNKSFDCFIEFKE